MKHSPLHNQRGVAMMMALVTMFILVLIAGEIVYQSGVYTSVVFRQRDQLRATLLARSGLRLALFQLRATRKAKAKAQSMGLGNNSTLVDQIWQTPIVLPPPDIPGLAPSDLDTLKKFRESLGLDGTVSITILGENGRMSINALAWPSSQSTATSTSTAAGTTPAPAPTNESETQMLEQAKKTVHDNYVKLVDNMLEKKRETDDKFRDKYSALNGEILVGNIQAWLDPTVTVDGNQRDKMDYYNRVEPNPYYPKNAPVASDSEYHMIEQLDDTLAKMVSDNFTVQMTTSLDVNHASILLIHAIIPELTPDSLERLDKRRSDPNEGGPFQTADDFYNYLNTLGSYSDVKQNLQNQGITVLGSDATYHAVITAHIDNTNTNKTWLADIGPLPPPDPGGTSTSTASTTQYLSQTTSTGTSTSTSTANDYDAVSVVYLKAD